MCLRLALAELLGLWCSRVGVKLDITSEKKKNVLDVRHFSFIQTIMKHKRSLRSRIFDEIFHFIFDIQVMNSCPQQVSAV